MAELERRGSGWVRFLVVLLLGFTTLSTALAGDGALPTASDPLDPLFNPLTIKDRELARWIDEFIPAATKRLLIFSMCFGGDFLDDFATKVNTAAASANEAGAEATSPGYTDGVPGSLRPEAGRTAEDAHKEASIGAARETPQAGGGLPLNQFPLDPVSDKPDAKVGSRHILIYAGNPEPSTLVSEGDDKKRDAVKKKFATEAGTTVRSIGGSGSAAPGHENDGTGGWDKPASPANLKQAIKEIGEEIKRAADPSKEQFIFIVFDHGSGKKTKELRPIELQEDIPVPGFDSYRSDELDGSMLRRAPNNVPGFSIFLPFTDGLTHAVNVRDYDPFFAQGTWTIDLKVQGTGQTVLLDRFIERPFEVDNSRLVGDAEGEGLLLYFPLDEAIFLGSLFDATLDAVIHNRTAGTARQGFYAVTEFAMETGAVPHLAAVPRPASWLMMLVAGGVILMFRMVRA